MCYSAQIVQDYRRYVRAYGADIDLQTFVDLFWRRRTDPKVKISKAMEAAFLTPASEGEHRIKDLIAEFAQQEAMKLEQELFKQRKRLADAERSLQTKTTKAATESRRIAASKVEWALGKLADLRRTELTEEDSRIFPGHYAPVLVMEDGRRVVKPMRYQCRPAGKPAFYDAKYPGTYNASAALLTVMRMETTPSCGRMPYAPSVSSTRSTRLSRALELRYGSAPHDVTSKQLGPQI